MRARRHLFVLGKPQDLHDMPVHSTGISSIAVVLVLGFLDDAIMVELCVRDLKHEIEAYRDFRAWRDDEASRRRKHRPAHADARRLG